MRAIGKNLIVSPVKEEKRGGLIIPVGKEKVLYWKVVSVGDEVKGISLDDEVCVAMYGEHKISDDLDLYVVQQEHVYAVK